MILSSVSTAEIVVIDLLVCSISQRMGLAVLTADEYVFNHQK